MMGEGGYAFIPPGVEWSVKNETLVEVKFHWIRKSYEDIEGLSCPESFVVNENDIAPSTMPDIMVCGQRPDLSP